MSSARGIKAELALDEALQEIADLKDMLENLSGAEFTRGAHIPVSWETFGDVSVGIDAAGNAVEVRFGGLYWEGS